jgi:hypothetical protein
LINDPWYFSISTFQDEVHNNKTNGEHDEEHDPYFEPVITLPEVHIYSMEEDEENAMSTG